MTVFAELMLEAKKYGAIELNFNVNITKYSGVDAPWAARATLADPVNVPHVAVGRTGEEALRELVVYLKAIGG